MDEKQENEKKCEAAINLSYVDFLVDAFNHFVPKEAEKISLSEAVEFVDQWVKKNQRKKIIVRPNSSTYLFFE